MTRLIAAGELDLRAFLRPGDRIFIGQACAEPCTLVETLIDQGRELSSLSAFTGSSFSGLFTPGTADSFALSSMGTIGSLRAMATSGELTIIPF